MSLTIAIILLSQVIKIVSKNNLFVAFYVCLSLFYHHCALGSLICAVIVMSGIVVKKMIDGNPMYLFNFKIESGHRGIFIESSSNLPHGSG